MRAVGIILSWALCACAEAPAPPEPEPDYSQYCDEDPQRSLIQDDQDCDGILAQDDCNDLDDSSTKVLEDADCDGVLTADDCDDLDPLSTSIAEDADCDGVLTEDDCDDESPALLAIAGDQDCDGVLTADDCDDRVPSAQDMDCDGIISSRDCDDFNASVGDMANDLDCDGFVSEQDCDDFNPASTHRGIDQDCDFVLTADDCDDADAFVKDIANDQDCDGTIASDDCDDTDSESTIIELDADCDGVLSADDCDDASVLYGAEANDLDCDGVITIEDCDDSDPQLLSVELDADCDGVQVDQDCDDEDFTFRSIADDADCDGVFTADDCDDSDPDTVSDMDCDQVPTTEDCNDFDANILEGTPLGYQVLREEDHNNDGVLEEEELWFYNLDDQLLSHSIFLWDYHNGGVDSNEEYHFTYTVDGHLATQRQVFSASAYVEDSYLYDEEANIISVQRYNTLFNQSYLYRDYRYDEGVLSGIDEFDSYGILVRTENYIYDENDRRVETTEEYPLTGEQYHRIYDSAGRVLSYEVLGSGYSETFSYDLQGNLIGYTETDNGILFCYTHSYDGSNLRILTEYSQNSTSCGAPTSVWAYIYSSDLDGVTLRIEKDDLNDTVIDDIEYFVYDTEDRLIQSSRDDAADGTIDYRETYTTEIVCPSPTEELD